MLRFSTLILILASFTFGVAQENEEEQEQEEFKSPIHKGTFITNLSGRISSGITNQESSTSSNIVINNDYILGTKSGYFIGERWVLGGNLFLQREAQESNALKTSSETFFVGPWIRYYFGINGNTAVYAEYSPLYVKSFSSSYIEDDGLVEVSLESIGGGFGSQVGVGFNYFLSEKAGFNIGVNLIKSKYKSELKDFITATSKEETINKTSLVVEFGFEIYLNQFFF